jgi:predicted site-specific integrase-resolvase
MNLLTAKQASEKWGISTRRVTRLCEEGRIKGAAKIAGAWLMPADARKPSDARIKSGQYIKKKNKNA